jgi:hypothetical protein
MAALLVAHGRPGFYLRVLEEGEVEAGDEILRVAWPRTHERLRDQCAAVHATKEAGLLCGNLSPQSLDFSQPGKPRPGGIAVEQGGKERDLIDRGKLQANARHCQWVIGPAELGRSGSIMSGQPNVPLMYNAAKSLMKNSVSADNCPIRTAASP